MHARGRLIVEWVLGVSKVKDDAGMGFCATAVGKLLVEVDASVEGQAAVLVQVDIESLEVSWGVDEADLARLHEVIGHNQVLLVGRHLDVVRADGGLILIRVIEPLHVVQVADVQCGNVVGGGQGQVDEISILGEVGTVVMVRHAKPVQIVFNAVGVAY